MDSETNPEDTDYVDVIIFPSAKAKVLRFPIVSKVIWIVNNGRKEEDLASELGFMSAVCGFCWLVPSLFDLHQLIHKVTPQTVENWTFHVLW